MSSKNFDRVKLMDLISRIIPSTFFLFVVMLKSVELYAFLKGHQATGEPASWKLFVDVLSRTSTVCFLTLMTVLFFIRLEPVAKAKSFLPRVMAIAGTFFVALSLFSRAPSFHSRK